LNWWIFGSSPRLPLQGGQALLFRLVTINCRFYRFVDIVKATMKISSHTQCEIREFVDASLRFADGLF
jgi:hypothetical protein